MTYQVGQLFEVVNKDHYHLLEVGSIVRFVGMDHSKTTLCFELVDGKVDLSLLDVDDPDDFDGLEHLHDCNGIVPSGWGQYLRPHHIQPLHNEDEDDLYV